MIKRPDLAPPAPEPRPVSREHHGISWSDPFHWLRDPAYPKVEDEAILAYLEEENAYFTATMEPLESLVEALHEELKGKLEREESSVPAPEGPWAYFWRFDDGAQYRSWYRVPRDGGEERLLLAEPRLAADKSYFNLRALTVDPGDRFLAYTTDEDGSERYAVHLLDLRSGAVRSEVAVNTVGSSVWSLDGCTLYMVELSAELRPYRVLALRPDEPASDLQIVFEEKDPAFFVSLGRTLSRRFITITTGTHETEEVWLIDSASGDRSPRLVAARRSGHRYSLSHRDDRLWIISNDRHENFRLVSAPVDDPSEQHWHEEIPPSDELYLLDIVCFRHFDVIALRRAGLRTLHIRPLGQAAYDVTLDGESGVTVLGENREFDASSLRLIHSSLVTPRTIVDHHVESRHNEILKVQKVPAGYDAAHYRSQRLLAAAADGERVPISIVHRDDWPQDGSGSMLLYGYGAYGMAMEPSFNALRLPLLDRGIAFAIAHVRGGDELGHRWYRLGKGPHKTSSFSDFITCAEHLVEVGLARAGNIAIRGGSAGGMLIGAVCNLRPDLWRCAVLEVPFVDVLNTMLDTSLPLTPIEWPEWGNPLLGIDDFRMIAGYSPYDNIRPQDYPAMLVTGGISDPRVTYWEPAKWVARLRRTKTDDNALLLQTKMTAGHFGVSGRWDALRDTALIYAFILASFGQDRPAESVATPASAS